MENRGHKLNPNGFCYICAKYISGIKRSFTPTLQEAYWTYFRTSFSDFYKDFTPSYICTTCQRNLYKFMKNNDYKFPFSCPAIWIDGKSHDFGICYFCSIAKPSLKRKWEYFDCATCKIPKLYAEDLVDQHNANDIDSEFGNCQVSSEADSNNEEFTWSIESFNDFCRELDLSKIKSKKCLSMLKKDPDLKMKLKTVTVRHVNDRSNYVVDLYSISGRFVYLKKIDDLMKYLDVPYTSNDWCLFIDSSISSLKAALMYKNNTRRAIPIAYAKCKEDRGNIQILLQLIDYNSHGWIIMSDLKVLNLVIGLKAGYAKYPCYYCMFDSRQSQLDFDQNHTWPCRVNYDSTPLVPVEKIVIPFLHVKLGLFQKFVKSLDKESDCFKFICETNMKSEAKLRNGIFNGPEIKRLINNDAFPKTMTELQHTAWMSFCDVVSNVLGKNISEQWKEKVDLSIYAFQAMGCANMSTKMHLLFKHKDKFESYLGIFSDEHGERLHQDMQHIEKRYGNNLKIGMIAEYVWSLKRDTKLYNSSKKPY